MKKLLAVLLVLMLALTMTGCNNDSNGGGNGNGGGNNARLTTECTSEFMGIMTTVTITSTGDIVDTWVHVDSMLASSFLTEDEIEEMLAEGAFTEELMPGITLTIEVVGDYLVYTLAYDYSVLDIHAAIAAGLITLDGGDADAVSHSSSVELMESQGFTCRAR